MPCGAAKKKNNVALKTQDPGRWVPSTVPLEHCWERFQKKRMCRKGPASLSCKGFAVNQLIGYSAPILYARRHFKNQVLFIVWWGFIYSLAPFSRWPNWMCWQYTSTLHYLSPNEGGFKNYKQTDGSSGIWLLPNLIYCLWVLGLKTKIFLTLFLEQDK